VIKKFNLPSFQPLTEAQRESKMMDVVGQRCNILDVLEV